MKKRVRKIVVNEQTWTWVVESDVCAVKEVRIYSPNKKMFRLKPWEISSTKTYEEIGGDSYYTIKPIMIREYIEKNLINL